MAVSELVIKDLSGPCAGLVYEVNPVAGATGYTWTLPTDWKMVSGQGTNRIMVTAGTAPGDISVTATNGVCSSNRTSIQPNAAVAGASLVIPNVFSPNNDGDNDTWVIEHLENFTDNELTILNRWGNEVYKAKSYKNTWNGSSLTEGTYFYLLKVKVCDGTDRMYKGYLTLVR
jgi:gliding motility-associated-like protein